jgi:hypothetical protein
MSAGGEGRGAERRRGHTRVAEGEAIRGGAKGEEAAGGLEVAEEALEEEADALLDVELVGGGEELDDKVEEALGELGGEAGPALRHGGSGQAAQTAVNTRHGLFRPAPVRRSPHLPAPPRPAPQEGSVRCPCPASPAHAPPQTPSSASAATSSSTGPSLRRYPRLPLTPPSHCKYQDKGCLYFHPPASPPPPATAALSAHAINAPVFVPKAAAPLQDDYDDFPYSAADAAAVDDLTSGVRRLLCRPRPTHPLPLGLL